MDNKEFAKALEKNLRQGCLSHWWHRLPACDFENNQIIHGITKYTRGIGYKESDYKMRNIN